MKTTPGHLATKPQTNSGNWSIWLEVAFVLMFIANIPFNIYVIQPNAGPNPVYYMAFILFMLMCGIIGGVIGLIAVIKQHERSLLVWLSILVGLFALLIFLNELMQGLQYLLST